jgi:predicted extracellular nuclease
MLGLLGSMAGAVAADSTTGSGGLFFSEYIEGSSNNKALEIYNDTGATADLTGYAVKMYFNGSSSAGLTINLAGTVAAGDVYVLAQSSASSVILAQADQTSGAGWFNGDDAVALVHGSDTLDVIGQIGFDPGAQWGSGLTSTQDNTLRRKPSIHQGDPDGTDVFDPAVEWDGYATDTFDGLGSHTVDGGTSGDTAPSVVSVSPAADTTGVDQDSNVTVTFSEPVTLGAGWYTLACASTGEHTGAVSGGPTSYTIDPSADFGASESCTLTVHAAQVADVDSNDPPDTMAADFTSTFSTSDPCESAYTAVPEIQGSTDTSPKVGQTVTTEGVVVGDYEGAPPALGGFFVQDPTGDGDPATSDGLSVYNGSRDQVANGQLVRVTGRVSEFNGQTEVSASKVVGCGTGTVAPTDVTLPFANGSFPERYEGMLVRMPQTLSVTEHYGLGRYGEVLLSAGGRLYEPTTLVAPGAAANALQAQNDLDQILLDDGSTAQDPDPIVFGRDGQPLSATNTLRGGDTAAGIVGVLAYEFGAYALEPVHALGGSALFTAANPRPAAPPDVHGSLRVAGMNLLNFFNTFSGCAGGVGGEAMDCRGADNAAEFDRQWPKTVAAILGTGADVVGVAEMQNNGYGPDSAIAFLVGKLNAATAPGTWAYVDADAATGQVNALGTDAIKVGVLYQPGRATPVGTTAALNSVAFVNGGDSAPRNRPALAQAFRENATGETFVLSVNHLKSKGSACDLPDQNDGQANCAAVRTNAATLLSSWLKSDPTGTGAGTLIVGDLNSYAKEDPIAAFAAGGFENLIASRIGDEAYSYVFNGEWGYLDYALGGTGILGDVTDIAEWHINADEPTVLDYNTNFKSAHLIESLYAADQYRMSDHDPVLVGLDLHATVAGLEYLVGQYVTKNEGLRNSLVVKLEHGSYDAFANELRAQSGKALTAEQAQTLLDRVAGL